MAEEQPTKVCKNCNTTQSIDNFYRNAKTRDGKHIYCKNCMAEKRRDYYRKKPERIQRKKVNQLINFVNRKGLKVQGDSEPENGLLRIPPKDAKTKNVKDAIVFLKKRGYKVVKPKRISNYENKD